MNVLNEWLKKEGLKKYKFAESCGISNATLSRICKGFKTSALSAKLIEKRTRGEVKACEICAQEEKLKNIKNVRLSTNTQSKKKGI